MDIQAWLPIVLCAIHNFIHRYKPDVFFEPELTEGDQLIELGDVLGVLGDGPADASERRRADHRCDNIAQEMWQDYQQEPAHCRLQVS